MRLRDRVLRTMLAGAATCAVGAGCGDDGGLGPDAMPPDPPRTATGRRLIDHPAVIGGLTTDGYVAFADNDDAGHSVAKVMPIAGGDPIVLATSLGTGKPDVRWEIRGGVVFAWTDRLNRMGTLTTWSAATGVVEHGPGIRPGRVGATADGALIAYQRDITTDTAAIVIGPIDGAPRVVATANALDSICWRDTDLASIGARALVRYCPAGATAFALRSVTADGTATELSRDAVDAAFGTTRAVWRDADGALASTGDGVAVTPLATATTDFVVTRDLSRLAYLTAAGAIHGAPTDGSAAARELVAAPAAQLLGALAPDGATVLYAGQVDDRGAGHLAPYTDVIAADAGGARPLVTTATSCPACLADSFSPDGQYALVLDPIDHTPAFDGAGPLQVFSLADGRPVATYGTDVYTAVAIDGVGLASRFLLIDSIQDPTQVTGWRYGLTRRPLDPSATAEIVAQGAENFAIDRARTSLVVSFDGTDALAGLWVVGLSQ